MKFDLKKLTIGSAAGLILGLGVGGSLGKVGAAVVSYEATAQGMALLQQDLNDPAVTKEQLAPHAQYVIDAFQSIDDNAKNAFKKASTPKAPATPAPVKP